MSERAAAISSADWQSSLLYHRSLLGDEMRNERLLSAVKRVVTSKTRFLDIGTGSGIWAIVAAKLGAKTVTAVEANETMIPVIYGHLRENNVQDRVNVVYGRSWDVELPHRYDVILSETIGNQGFDESIVRTMIDARKRFIARGGVMMPRSVSLMASLAHIKNDKKLPVNVPISANYLTQVCRNSILRVTDRQQFKLLGKPAELISADLTSIKSEPDFDNLTAVWKLDDISRANAVITWARADLVDKIKLDTWESLSWTPIVYQFEPFKVGKGQINFELNLGAKLHHWSVRLVSSNLPPRYYSPMFGFSKLSFDAFDHKR